MLFTQAWWTDGETKQTEQNILCFAFLFGSGSRPVNCNVGNSNNNYGWFNCNTNNNWNNSNAVRIYSLDQKVALCVSNPMVRLVNPHRFHGSASAIPKITTAVISAVH